VPNFAAPKVLSEFTSTPGTLSYSAGSGEAPDGRQVKIVDQGPERERHVEQELIFEGLVSYGNYTIFASGYDDKLFTAGVEYDRHSWGHFLKSQMDYVAEVLPFVLLDKPLCVVRFGVPCAPISQSKLVREYVPGIGISPIGFRWQWRSNTAIRPYLEAKGGMLGFTQKVPAAAAAYENFSLQSAMGVQIKMNERWGLRLGLFSDFHFSNAFVVPNNPGLDVMNANLGLSYHF
jgi:lipid A 3-O-deacylase PagL